MAMLPNAGTDRISKSFGERSRTSALMMSGCIAASYCFGLDPWVISTTLHSGLLDTVSSLPLENIEIVASHYFGGVAGWFSTVGLGVQDWLIELGADIPEYLSNATDAMRQEVASTFANSRHLFDSMVAKSSELASVWRGAVQDVLPPSVVDGAKTMIDMIPDNPADLARGLYDLGAKAVEGYGVVKSLEAGYKWVLSKFRKDTLDNKETEKAAEEAGVSPETAANLHVNVALGGQDVADKGVTQIREILEAAGDRSITLNLDMTEKKAEAEPAPAESGASRASERHASGIIENNMKRSGRRLIQPILQEEHVAWTSRRLHTDLRKSVHESISEIKARHGEVRGEEILSRPVRIAKNSDWPKSRRDPDVRAAAIAKFIKDNQVPGRSRKTHRYGQARIHKGVDPGDGPGSPDGGMT